MSESSDKNGPLRDDELKRELQGHLKATSSPRAEEGLRAEPPADDDPEVAEDTVSGAGSDGPPERLRLELARYLSRTSFPSDRDGLVNELRSRHAPDQLVESLAELPRDQRFGTVHELTSALGPEPRTR
ncbi:DUF2795 domain-containing protein [Streptomyces spiramenti]|uniref:DUF2795 domain-containing protein n=1 Tax=Streptomyces spiramenti TaxID=2720606 RepID=A0ABX1AKK8_9ACTN|nr:DUF2795 domain-containing protein [Streptomyces spiramenti]NJP65610.1 DUF2795 domain-containing protein [Streptomyces spiramenti]